MNIDPSVIIAKCDRSKENAERLKAVTPVLVEAFNAAGEDLMYAFFYPEEAKIIAQVKTRAAFAPVRALHRGIWSKDAHSDTGDGDGAYIQYNANVEGIEMRIKVSELPPTCRIETEEIEVPAHKETRRKIICNSPELQPA